MIQKTIGDIMLLQFVNLAGKEGISHCITTRNGGFSEGLYKSLNLSLNVGDSSEIVMMNREKVASFFDLNLNRLFIPSQCHTNNVKSISERNMAKDLAETDALITNVKGLAIAVMAADCVPILFFDPIEQTIAAIHAGWKGTILNIVSSAIDKMITNYRCRPENLYVGIGPCISSEMYEVGEDVASEFRKLFGNNPQIIRPGKNIGKSHINLQEANRNLLLHKGVLTENIETADICTYNHPDLFFSARRDGAKCGRFASVIILKN